LLAPANEALGDECLTGVITEYPWPEGIALMTIFLMFFLELMTMRYGNFGDGHSHDHHEHRHAPHAGHEESISLEGQNKYTDGSDNSQNV
jgi:solute carrier family 39 (zinc transporter), member 1/2/3